MRKTPLVHQTDD